MGDKTKTHILHNEYNEEFFIRWALYGGLTCPRGKVIENGMKYNYLDISGMYAAVMQNADLPYGKHKW